MRRFRHLLLFLLPLVLIGVAEAQSATIRLTVPSASMTGDCFFEKEYGNTTEYAYDCMSEADAKVWFKLNASTNVNGSLHTQAYSASMVGENLLGALSYLRFNATGMTFQYFYFRVYYTDADIANNGLDESALTAFRWDGGSWVSADQVAGVFGVGVNATGNYVWVNTSVLSDWGLGGQKQQASGSNTQQLSGYVVSTMPPPSLSPSQLLADFKLKSVDAVIKSPLVIEIEFENARVNSLLLLHYSTGKFFGMRVVKGSDVIVPEHQNFSYIYNTGFTGIGVYKTVVRAEHAGVTADMVDYVVVLPELNSSKRTMQFLVIAGAMGNGTAANETVRMVLGTNKSVVMRIENDTVFLFEEDDLFKEYHEVMRRSSGEIVARELTFRERVVNSIRFIIVYHQKIAG